MRLLDLFCGAGGCSVGYERAGFDVVGVDIAPQKNHRGGAFVQADALEYVAAHGHEFDAIHASPPCQAHSSLKHVTGKQYADLIPATRAALEATGKPYVIENVPGAPLGGGSTYLLLLCGTMFGLVTPDGRAEIRRHRLFETNWCFGLRPQCQHGGAYQGLSVTGHAVHGHRDRELSRRVSGDRRKTLSVAGNSPEDRSGPRQENGRRITLPHMAAHGQPGLSRARRARRERRAMSVTGNTPQTNTVRNTERETFTVDEARAAMGIPWMPMKSLSQAIPPAYTEWIGRRLLGALA